MTELQKYIEQNSGLECLPDNAQYTNRFEIKSETSNRIYVVAQRKSDGVICCSCMGWKRARNGHLGRKYKHTDAIAPLLERAKKVVENKMLE